MKLLSMSVAAAALVAASGAAFAITPDSESLVYNLNGSIPSVCTLTPDGPINVNVNMTNYSSQGITGVAYSCNSPYKLTIKSLNGGMKHAQSALNLEYDVHTLGVTDSFIPVAHTFQSMTIKTTPGVVASQSDWENILTNGGIQAGTVDLDLPNLSNQGVAGDYSDVLTLTLTAQL